MNLIELNIILFYADFLSLREKNIPVTDNCKYYFIHGFPVNCAYTLDLEPIYDPGNEYIMKAAEELDRLDNKFGEDGVMSFLEDICCLRSRGCVNGRQMLDYIHMFDTKYERKQAVKDYENWLKNQSYAHLETNDKGDKEYRQCSRYVAHAEGLRSFRRVRKSSRNNTERSEI